MTRSLLSTRVYAFLLLTLFRGDVAAAQERDKASISFTVRVLDENNVSVSRAQIKLSGKSFSTGCETNYLGSCPIQQLPVGSYTLQVSKPGFYIAAAGPFVPQQNQTVEVSLVHQQEVKETVNVTASQPTIDPQQTASRDTFTSKEIIDIPYPTTRDIRAILPFIPGVVPDPVGNQSHVAGAATYQTFDMLDGFNITGPVGGLLNIRVSADAVRRINVEQSRYSAEYGKGSGGFIGFETGMGDDHLRFSATNFIPSVQFKKGLNFDKWVPRATLSGPISKGHAWFFEAPDAEYDTNIIKQLPNGADSAPLLRFSNLAKAQINLSPQDILTASFLFNSLDQHHSGLSVLTPQSATSNLKQFAYLPALREQHSFANGVLAEFGIAWLDTTAAERPLGSSPYLVRPEGVSGNFFRSSDSTAHRLQGISNIYFPVFSAMGRHEIKLGVDLDHLSYDQSTRRTPISVLREDGTLSEQITFPGSIRFSTDENDVSAYIQDRWSVTEHLLVEAGIRMDHDSIIRDFAVGPRLASTYAPRDGTKFSAGVGIYYDQTNLALLTRPFQGPRTENFYTADGSTLTSTREVLFDANPASLKVPRFWNWSIAYEQRLPAQTFIRAEFIQKRGNYGLAYFNESPPTAQTVHFVLQSTKQDHYDALQLSARHTFNKNEYFLFASYLRSSARSNAVIDFNPDQIFDPLFTAQTNGPQPWDTPNRLLSYGFLPLPKPLPKRVDFSYTFEWRTGFPYSWVNQNQQIVGAPDSHRFPDYLDLAPYIEIRFPLFKLNWAVRGGFDNITGHANPAVVNNNVDSPNFLQFTQLAGRSFTARIRFLGRK